ncbi:MAG: hypothetical protein U0325_02085 [Polyangiales bacterium]
MGSRAWLGVTLLLVACSDDSGRFFPPADDAAQTTDATTTDVVATDIVGTDIVSTDAPRDVPVDRPAPVDRGPNNCPSGCATNNDCAPCAERSGELFCCVSGLCVFTSEPMCVATPDGGGVNPDGGGDGGGDGGAQDASNPFDDVAEPDSGSMMPEDVPATPTDNGAMDGGATDGGARGDVVNDLAGDTAG